MSDLDLDDLDRRIVRELQEDGLRSFRDIAREVGVSERTIRSRVKRLQDSGVLRIVAFADPLALGRQQLAFVLIRARSHSHDQIVKRLIDLPEVAYASTLMGRWDLYVQVVCRDNEELWQFVRHRIGELDGVLETETLVELDVHKFVYMYPTLGEGP